MILMRISNQADIIDVCLHFGPTGNQFLRRESVSQDM